MTESRIIGLKLQLTRWVNELRGVGLEFGMPVGIIFVPEILNFRFSGTKLIRPGREMNLLWSGR